MFRMLFHLISVSGNNDYTYIMWLQFVKRTIVIVEMLLLISIFFCMERERESMYFVRRGKCNVLAFLRNSLARIMARDEIVMRVSLYEFSRFPTTNGSSLDRRAWVIYCWNTAADVAQM